MSTRKTSVDNSRTGQATAVGGYANSGVHVGDVNLYTGAAVRTRYLEQVRRIAPRDLLDRDAELAELASFCADPDTRGQYAWWRAEAWAGKSALMSWFLLHPPRNVRLVSFFITARLASQNDRVSFGDNVLEQLAAILGVSLPHMTDSTRDAHVLGMLHDAAHLCEARGENFVLIVDGLDEDRGVTIGREAHSIAALLPLELPSGMRVILTGRPHPPVPDDVPGHHPLRDPGIVRMLSVAQAAKVVRADMLRELRLLLEGDEGERALLGFLTVAGGGLTALDLAELAGRPAWRIDEYLATVAGRSFTRRGSHWRPELMPDAYLLGHEELQAVAEDLLGQDQLGTYRGRLFAWADGYRDRGWPASTPEYLLRGYFQMLTANGDISRMIGCGTDHRRHDRMLDVSGGDAAALAEIASSQDMILKAGQPDLNAMMRLAMHRDHLAERNADIPSALPAVWTSLGQISRSEALATSIADAGQRCAAMLRMARRMALASNLSDARDSINRATASLRTITDLEHRNEAAAAAIETMVAIGRPEWAEEFAAAVREPAIDDALRQARASGSSVAVLEDYLETIVPLDLRADTLSQLAEKVVSRVGRHDQAPVITARLVAEWITERRLPAKAKIQLAHAASRLLNDRQPLDALVASDADEAVLAGIALAACTAEYIDAAAFLVALIDNPTRRVEAVTSLIEACVAVDDFDIAESMISVCGDAEYRTEAAMSLAALYARTGHADRAHALMLSRQFLIDEVCGEDGHIELKAKAAVAWAVLGDSEQADRVAGSIGGANDLARVFTALAAAFIDGQDFDTARRFAADAEVFARMSVTTTSKVQGFTALSHAFAATGDVDRAEAIARVAVGPDGEPSALEHLARTLVELRHHQRGLRIAHSFAPLVRDRVLVDMVTTVNRLEDLDWATETARGISTHPAQIRALAHCARVAIAGGAYARAEEITRSTADPIIRTEIATGLLQQLRQAGESDHIKTVRDWASKQRATATRKVDQVHADRLFVAALAANREFGKAIAAVRSLTPDAERGVSTVPVIAAAAMESRYALADRLLATVTSDATRAWALDEMVTAAITMGDFERVTRLVGAIDDADLRDRVRVEVVMTAGHAGQENLESLIQTIESAQHRAWAQVSAVTVNFADVAARELAEEASREVSDDSERLELLLTLLEAAVEAGDVGWAEGLIRRTADTNHRGRAWAVLADLTGSERSLALALRWGGWTAPMSVFVRLRPDELPHIEEEFFKINPDNVAG